MWELENKSHDFGERVDALRDAGSADDAEALDENGIARTTIFCPLSRPAACWLANRFPNQAEIDWDEETEERVGSIDSAFTSGPPTPNPQHPIPVSGLPTPVILPASPGGACRGP